MWKKTKSYVACAASGQTGTKKEFQTDSLMQIMSREDLKTLFPGAEHLKLRKTIFEILHDQKQTHEFLKYLKSCIHQNSLNDAAVTEYLHRINNIKDKLDQMQIVLGAHKMQKDINKNQVSQKGPSSDTKALMITNGMQRGEQRGLPSVNDPPQENPVMSFPETVKYKMVVSGQTFDVHRQLLHQIQTSGLNLERNDEESCITIVFCPVGTRIGTDAKEAMRMVPADDRVILVLMHYSQEPKHVSSLKVLPNQPNIVSEVHVFYHDKQNGLLRCEQNEKAVNELKKELMKYSRPQCSGPNYENQSNSCTSF